MIDKGKSISFFKKGDIITRVIPSVIGKQEREENFVKVEKEILDYSYRGVPMKYIGIANNMIYLESQKEIDKILKIDNISLEIERWENGWEIYIDPSEL